MDYNITSLTTLLNESKEAAEAYENKPHSQAPVEGGQMVIKGYGASNKAATVPKSKGIWDAAEIPSQDALGCQHDDRPCPRYEFSYKQIVGTEDTILGLGVSE